MRGAVRIKAADFLRFFFVSIRLPKKLGAEMGRAKDLQKYQELIARLSGLLLEHNFSADHGHNDLSLQYLLLGYRQNVLREHSEVCQFANFD